MKITFYKGNRIDDKHELSVNEIIKDFYKTEQSKWEMPFERLILNFMSLQYGSFEQLTDKEWNALYQAKRNRTKV